jgi:hypothetical protein
VPVVIAENKEFCAYALGNVGWDTVLMVSGSDICKCHNAFIFKGQAVIASHPRRLNPHQYHFVNLNSCSVMLTRVKCSVDRASLYNLVNGTNLVHNILYS